MNLTKADTNQLSFLNNTDVHNSVAFFKSSSSFETWNGEILKEVDLPYAALQNPHLAIAYLISKTIIVGFGLYVHIQTLKFLKHETCLVKEVMKVFLYVQMAYWPVKVVFETTTDLIYPLGDILGKWYCHFGFLWLTYGMTLIVFHSFIVGLMRYMVVVHHDQMLQFGIEKAKTLFYWMNILVPLVMTVWAFIGRREVSSVSTLIKCYGTHVEAFLVEEDIETTTMKSFCAFEKYEEEGNETISALKRLFCIVHTLIYVLMGVNVVEGFFYWRTVRFSNKYAISTNTKKSIKII